MDNNANTNHTVDDLIHMLDEHDCSLIAIDLYERLEPNADQYDFMGKDENFSLKYILSKIPLSYDFEKMKISKLKRMVGALVIRSKLGEFMLDVGRDLECDFYFEDIGICVDKDSLHTDISRLILEASRGTTKVKRNSI